jgi:hypothetical protein
MFEKADANKDGTIGGPEVTNFAEPYKASAQISGGEGGDTELTITQEQFKEACMKDAFKDVQMPRRPNASIERRFIYPAARRLHGGHSFVRATVRRTICNLAEIEAA